MLLEAWVCDKALRAECGVAGDTTPAGDTSPCRMTEVTLHGVVSPEGVGVGGWELLMTWRADATGYPHAGRLF